MIKGQVISGEFGKILARIKKDAGVEIGELFITEHDGKKILLQVYDLIYGSQISQINLELMSGLKLEEDNNLELWDEHLRTYNVAVLKSILIIENNSAKVAKELPGFFSLVREVKKEDLYFLGIHKNPMFLGRLRSGSKVLDVDIFLRGDKVLPEHILIPATTGRGKSNLTSCMLWDLLDKDYSASLVLDPHDEYYGRNDIGLKDHPNKKVVYYSPTPPAGCRSLKINLKDVLPKHFNGAVNWSDAQKEALNAYHRKYKEKWIEEIIKRKEVEGFADQTMAVIRRRMKSLLRLSTFKGEVRCAGVFSPNSGQTTIKDICEKLETSNTVIIDTSGFSGAVEILIGTMITTHIFSRYRNYKINGELKDKPVISIVLEEAPRVLGKEVLEKGSNIFSTIAREGRKFKVGLIAITQLPSLIPRQVLANMNTKIILGVEMAPERTAIIESASQDLSNDSRSIASLDKGEAIITSNFARFAIPIKIPFFPEIVKHTQNKQNKEKYIKNYAGINE